MRCRATGKVRHPTHGTACAAVKRVKNKGLDIYRCQSCKGFHLGTSRKPWKVQARISELLAQDRTQRHAGQPAPPITTPR